MAARPRKLKHKDYPPNLYPNKKNGTTYYRYRSPEDGKWHPMGSNKQEAISAAKQLNSILMPGSNLVARVMGEDQNQITVSSFITTFTETEIPKRKWAKDTLNLFAIRTKQINASIGNKNIDEITIRDIASFLDTLTPRASNQARSYLIDIFNHAIAKGLCPDNPAEHTIKQIEEKQRKRHTVDGLKAIRKAAPEWLKNAIDLALITAQRRGDILNMRFEDIKDNFLYVIQHKTEKASDAGWIRFELTPQLKEVIGRCRDNIPSPFLVHRKPDAKRPSNNRDHWTQIQGRYLAKAFQKAREDAGVYSHLSESEMPTFHEIRALSIHLYKMEGKDAQKIAGHSSADMTKNYQKNHEEIIW